MMYLCLLNDSLEHSARAMALEHILVSHHSAWEMFQAYALFVCPALLQGSLQHILSNLNRYMLLPNQMRILCKKSLLNGEKIYLLCLSHRPTLLFPVFTVQLWGHVVEQLLEALRYKPEGREFDSRWCHWNPSGRTMALGSTQPLTELCTRNIS